MSRRLAGRFCGSISLAALILGAAPAFAADSVAKRAAAPTPAPAPAAQTKVEDVGQSARQANGLPGEQTSSNTIRNNDDVIVTGSLVNAQTPITSSVHTFEPQSIVSRSIIENAVPPTADFSDVALLTPGASGTSNGNGPGLSESKTVLRGFQDGQFNVTYDGVPFQDSNDPTHHSTAYFPTGTYERVIVDRGPGSATDLGQASFGGNIHLISRELSDHARAEVQGVYGSYNTWLGRVTLQSGAIDKLDGLRVIAVGEYKQTDGALTHSNAWFANGFVKLEKPLGSRGKFTLLSSYNQDYYNQSDSNGVTCAPLVTGGVRNSTPEDASACLAGSQVQLYGKRFGLVDVNDPTFANTPYVSSRYDWNWTNKTTDFEIARLQVNLTDWLSVDNKAYTFFYKNFTVSTETSTVACTGAFSPTSCGGMNTVAAGANPGIAGAKISGDIPGYTKVNQYRNWGDILQVEARTPIGILKIGAWYENSSSHRYRYDYDFTRAFNAGGFGHYHFDFGTMANYYNYKETDKAANVQIGGTPVPLYIKYDEHTGWEQIQGFGEFELKAFGDRLTITPGIKLQNFTRTINTPIAAQSSRIGIQAHDSYRPKLPYLTVNFLAQPNWSFYAQYAKGFLIPALSNGLEAQPAVNGVSTCPAGVTCGLQPTKTTNYQFGTVYAGNRLNIDADVYLIDTSNSTNVDPSTGVATQSGNPARYKGIEGQVSYVVIPHLTAIVNGSLNEAKDRVTHTWLQQAPNYTALAGLVYSSNNLKLSYLHKFTGRQYADAGNLVAITPYSTGIASGTVYFGPIGVGVTVYNVFDNQATTKISGSTGGTPLYFFQPGRSYQAQARLRF